MGRDLEEIVEDDESCYPAKITEKGDDKKLVAGGAIKTERGGLASRVLLDKDRKIYKQKLSQGEMAFS